MLNAENRTSKITHQKVKYQKNPEVQLVYQKCRCNENRENKVKYRKSRYQKNPEKQTEYKTAGVKKILKYKENIEKVKHKFIYNIKKRSTKKK